MRPAFEDEAAPSEAPAELETPAEPAELEALPARPPWCFKTLLLLTPLPTPITTPLPVPIRLVRVGETGFLLRTSSNTKKTRLCNYVHVIMCV